MTMNVVVQKYGGSSVADLVALCVEPAHRPLGRSARRSTVPPS